MTQFHALIFVNMPAQDVRRPPQLKERWRAHSLSSVWLRPADWYHPAVDALAEAMASGADPEPAAHRLGAARAASGVGIGETIDDLACCYLGAGLGQPPLGTIRALCDGWVGAEVSEAVAQRYFDAESGLCTAEYLMVRLAETYGSAARLGLAAAQTHALVVLDLTGPELQARRRVACSAVIGKAITTVLGAGHPAATLGGGVFVALCARTETLGSAVRDLRVEVIAQALRFGIIDSIRRPPRIWIEPLPEDCELTGELLRQLAR